MTSARSDRIPGSAVILVLLCLVGGWGLATALFAIAWIAKDYPTASPLMDVAAEVPGGSPLNLAAPWLGLLLLLPTARRIANRTSRPGLIFAPLAALLALLLLGAGWIWVLAIAGMPAGFVQLGSAPSHDAVIAEAVAVALVFAIAALVYQWSSALLARLDRKATRP